jgi:DGC domain
MPELPKKKVGLVSCSGEELPEGTITRLATLRVLESLRPGETVTICLPLFLAGGEGDRAFARFNPTVTIDGCEKRCAARGTERYSAKPAASIVVTELCRGQSGGLGSARRLSESGMNAVATVAQEIARSVDRLLAGYRDKGADMGVDSFAAVTEAPAAATCSCGSGIPVSILEIAGRRVEVLALPLIFDLFRESGKMPGAGTGFELMETVRTYNSIPDNESASWKEVIEREYAAYIVQGAC